MKNIRLLQGGQVFWGLAMLLLATAFMAPTIAAADTLEDDLKALFGKDYFKENPHWKTEGCKACHTQKPTGSNLFLRGDANSVCTVCHAKGKAVYDLHPVGTKPSNKITIPKGFPLGAGDKTTCLTCHNHSNACSMKDRKIFRFFLRDAPYETVISSCYKCHKKEDTKSYNPHEGQIKEGLIEENRCKFCHEKVLDPKKKLADRNYHLRKDMSAICTGCHLATPHFSACEHLEIPAEKTRTAMKESEKQFGIIFPLDEKGKITCSTCHNPHEKGVFDEGIPAGAKYEEEKVPDTVIKKMDRFKHLGGRQGRYGQKKPDIKEQMLQSSIDIKPEKNMRLPARKGTLCTACHGTGGKQ